MKIGVPKEVKANENRVALVPAGAAALVAAGHSVFVEAGAGLGSAFSDEQYSAAGAIIAKDADATWAAADLIVKVKEPIRAEWPRIRAGQTIFTYFHFAADRELTQAHLDSGATCIAYETVQLPSGELPLLTPMSEVAGCMAVQEGAKYLEKFYGGRGVLLGGVPGVPPAHVVVIGGGVVGINAAKMAAGLGARVTILDLSLERLRYLSEVLAGQRTYAVFESPQRAGTNRHGRSGYLRCAYSRCDRAETDSSRGLEDNARRIGHRGCGGGPGRMCRDDASHHAP